MNRGEYQLGKVRADRTGRNPPGILSFPRAAVNGLCENSRQRHGPATVQTVTWNSLSLSLRGSLGFCVLAPKKPT